LAISLQFEKDLTSHYADVGEDVPRAVQPSSDAAAAADAGGDDARRPVSGRVRRHLHGTGPAAGEHGLEPGGDHRQPGSDGAADDVDDWRQYDDDDGGRPVA